MGFLFDRKLARTNPYASNPSTREREKTARRQEREARRNAGRGTRHRAEVRGGNKARWPW